MLNRSEDGYILTHSLIHTYARKHLKPDEEAIRRMAAHYEGFLKEQGRLDAGGFEKIDAERARIIAILCGCPEARVGPSLLWSLEKYCMYGGYYIDFRTALEHELEAACRLNDLKRVSVAPATQNDSLRFRIFLVFCQRFSELRH